MSPGPSAPPRNRWRRIPAATWLPDYQRGWWRGDLVAGSVVAALAVPQALGYASLAGAPVQAGLYAVPVALVAYAALGSSRQLVVGPVSTVSVLSGSFLASFGVAGTVQAASYTAALALASGLVLVAAGFLRIGWVAEFLSKPIVTGFVLGLTILVIVNEVPHLIGVPTPQGQVVERISALGEGLSRGEADPTTMLISAVSLLLLFGGARLVPQVPWGCGRAGRGAGHLGRPGSRGSRRRGRRRRARGLPTPAIPTVQSGDLPGLLSAGAALALVGLAEGLSAARLFAGRGGYRVDADQGSLASGQPTSPRASSAGWGSGGLSKTAAASDAREPDPGHARRPVGALRWWWSVRCRRRRACRERSCPPFF